MIAYLGEWIQHIVLLILMATFLDLLVPSSAMKKYVRMVVGLLIIMIILSPLLDLLQLDHERMMQSVDELFKAEQDTMGEQLEKQTEELGELQDEAVMSEVELLWAQEMKRDLGMNVDALISEVEIDLQIVHDQVDVQQVVIYLTEAEDVPISEEVESIAVVQPVQPIKVEINAHSTASNNDEINPDGQELIIEDKVISYLQEQWNISVDKISFSWTRR